MRNTKEFRRLQAVSRHPEYIKDYETLQVLEGWDVWRTLSREFVEKLPMGNKTLIEYREKFEALRREAKARREKTTILMAALMEKWRANPLPLPFHPAGIIDSFSYKDKPSILPHQKQNPSKTKTLTLDVILDKPKTELLREFKKLLETHQKDLPKKRDRKLKGDEFELYGIIEGRFFVYDLHHRDKIPFNEIARLVSGLSGNPAYGPELAKWVKRVKDAYRKGLKEIENIKYP